MPTLDIYRDFGFPFGDASFADVGLSQIDYRAGLYKYGDSSGTFTLVDFQDSGFEGLTVFGFQNTDPITGAILDTPVGDSTIQIRTLRDFDSVPVTQQFVEFSKDVNFTLSITYGFIAGETHSVGFFNDCTTFTFASGTATCDFGNTAVLTGFQVFDQDSTPVSNFSVFSVSLARDVRGGYSAAAVVPEPNTWAMLIAGFGLIGAAARRRRARTA